MTEIEPTTGAGGYRLKSEMARVCLPVPHANAQRNLAWANSVCLLFLIIGLVGFRPKPPPPLVVTPLEEVAPIIIEVTPPPPPPTTELKPNEEPKDQSATDAPRVVIVTPDSPKFVFSVPTVGNVVLPEAVATEAPRVPVQLTRTVDNRPIDVSNTGRSGDRPQPNYPEIARQLGQEGSVVLLLTGDAAGVITSVELKETSGSSILDHAASEYVKRHWTVPPGAPGRVFQATINYVLK